MSAVNLLRFHRSMLTDSMRLEGFKQAIESTVKAGDVVLDLGSGTGVLAVLAARAGARIVYAVEATEIVEIAREVSRRSGVEDRIVFLDDLSQRVNMPEPVDVLITETIGNFGLNEGILGWVRDARGRFLKNQAVVIPATIEMHLVPVELPTVYERDIDWDFRQSGIDFEPMRTFAVNSFYAARLSPENFLADPGSLGEVVLAAADSTAFAAEAAFEINKPGRFHGLGGWFSSRLCEGVSLSNDPHNADSSWSHTFLPIESPVSVVPGDRVTAKVSCANNGTVWRWQVEATTESSGKNEPLRFDQSTFYGSPGMASHLHRHAAGHAPALNLDGNVMSYVLGLMDGKRTLEDLAALTCEKFPQRFSDPAEALEHLRTISAEFAR